MAGVSITLAPLAAIWAPTCDPRCDLRANMVQRSFQDAHQTTPSTPNVGPQTEIFGGQHFLNIFAYTGRKCLLQVGTCSSMESQKVIFGVRERFGVNMFQCFSLVRFANVFYKSAHARPWKSKEWLLWSSRFKKKQVWGFRNFRHWSFYKSQRSFTSRHMLVHGIPKSDIWRSGEIILWFLEHYLAILIGFLAMHHNLCRRYFIETSYRNAPPTLDFFFWYRIGGLVSNRKSDQTSNVLKVQCVSEAAFG